jgi:hypothetical protein
LSTFRCEDPHAYRSPDDAQRHDHSVRHVCRDRRERQYADGNDGHQKNRRPEWKYTQAYSHDAVSRCCPPHNKPGEYLYQKTPAPQGVADRIGQRYPPVGDRIADTSDNQRNPHNPPGSGFPLGSSLPRVQSMDVAHDGEHEQVHNEERLAIDLLGR